jgi:hypothetical protein
MNSHQQQASSMAPANPGATEKIHLRPLGIIGYLWLLIGICIIVWMIHSLVDALTG